MKKLLTLVALSLFFSCHNESEKNSEKSNLYPSSLDFGEYDVGLQTLWTYDKTRNTVQYSDWNGRLYPVQSAQGRPFQINVWYPADSGNGSGPIQLKDYLELSYLQVQFEASESLIAFGKQEFKNKLVDLGGLDTLSDQDYDLIGSLTCKARKNARAAKGKFPVIIFPSGMAPASNSGTAEYLASHGYVVVAFPILGAEASTIDISSIGIEIAVDDIAFVLNRILELPFADQDNIGLIGNAVESSFCAAYLAQNQKIKAYVSLEGGFISQFEQGLLEGLPYYNAQAFTIPMLIIYSPHPYIDPSYAEHLRHAKRYFAHLPGMREFDYLNFGLLDTLVSGIIGEQRGNVQEGFSEAHLLMKNYFDVAFREGWDTFDSNFQLLRSQAIDTTFIWSDIPMLPSMAQIKNGFITERLAFMDSIYSYQKSFEETPFAHDFITDFVNWVAWKKDPEYTARKWIMEKAVMDYPKFSLYSYNLARYSLRNGDTTLAKQHYAEALRKLPVDPDESLTEEEKSTILENSRQALQNL